MKGFVPFGKKVPFWKYLKDDLLTARVSEGLVAVGSVQDVRRHGFRRPRSRGRCACWPRPRCPLAPGHGGGQQENKKARGCRRQHQSSTAGVQRR